MRLALNVVALALILCASDSVAQVMSPPPSSAPQLPPRKAALGVVKAVVVKSWGSGSGSLVWDHLNTNWASYGSTPIFIDATTLHDVGTFTLTDLQNSGADVVIVSDPSGGAVQWTPAEVAALGSYAALGHPLIGTYLLMQYQGIDNRALAPMWGLRSDLDYNIEPAAPAAEILAGSDCQFKGIANPLNLGGWPFVAVPADGSWDASDLAGASFVARSADGNNVVTTYTNGSIHSFYISYMPEYQSGSDFDATQYLYNAIVCLFGVTPTVKSSWGRVKSVYR